MGGKTRKEKVRKKPSGYEPEPQVPAALQDRYALVVAALSGELEVAEAARRAGLSRNRFQTLMHRAQQALIQSLEPKPPGRPPRPARELELEQQLERTQHQNEKLQDRVETIDRLLGVASGMLQGRIEPRPAKKWKSTSRKRKPSRSGGTDDDESDRRERLEAATEMRGLGLTPILAAAVVGVSASTVRRWAARDRRGEPPCERASARRQPPPPAICQQVASVVRELRGLVGAESLRHSVEGVSRRQAQDLKNQTLTEMERERRAACTQVRVHAPDVLRGFDVMNPRRGRNGRYILVAGDGAIPYRTQLETGDVYDSRAVLDFLEKDLHRNGRPLIYRLDRASQHRTAEVQDLLRQSDVLVLHGPPHHAQYYGALERQNREQSAWLYMQNPDDEDLGRACAAMKRALNATWRRRTLGWQTAEEAWQKRPPLRIDRAELRDRVDERAVQLRAEKHFRDVRADVVMRFAIEIELKKRGLLSQKLGGWC
jgi:transposase